MSTRNESHYCSRCSDTIRQYGSGEALTYGKWTPFLNYAVYTEHSDNWATSGAPSSNKQLSATLRYDLDGSSDVKFQLDRAWDTTNNFGGNVDVVRLSYDRVF